MYSSILSFETINKPKLFFECGIPRPQDGDTFACATETAPVKGRSHRVSVVYLCNNTSGREQGG
jgi:hypothetical protein